MQYKAIEHQSSSIIRQNGHQTFCTLMRIQARHTQKNLACLIYQVRQIVYYILQLPTQLVKDKKGLKRPNLNVWTHHATIEAESERTKTTLSRMKWGEDEDE